MTICKAHFFPICLIPLFVYYCIASKKSDVAKPFSQRRDVIEVGPNSQSVKPKTNKNCWNKRRANSRPIIDLSSNTVLFSINWGVSVASGSIFTILSFRCEVYNRSRNIDKNIVEL